MTRTTRCIFVTITAAVLVTPPPPAAEAVDEQFQTTATTFSGRARAVTGTVAGIPIELVDTEEVEAGGGTLEEHLLCYPGEPECTIGLPDLTSGALQAQVLNATVVAQGNHSRARASVADLQLKVAGQSIGATFLEANAHAQCADGHAFVRANANIVGLVINGQAIAISGDVGQKVEIPGVGVVIINEQVVTATGGGDGNITVRALHIVLLDVVDIIIAEAHADIVCGQLFCPKDKDFVTGGGWIGNPHKTFAVAGGIKNGAKWGHLLYNNHAGVRAKGTGVTDYQVTGPTSRHITGTCEINGAPGASYVLDIDDRGEPGKGTDYISLVFNNGEKVVGTLDSGNLQLHTCK